MANAGTIPFQELRQSDSGWLLRRVVFVLAIPAVGEQFLNTLVGLTDQFLVGHLDPAVASALGYTSADALASVGLGNLIVWMMTTLFMTVGIGATAVVARRIGEGREGDANLALRQTLLLGLLLGCLSTFVAFIGSEWILRTLGATPTVAAIGGRYMQIVALSFIPATVMFGGTAALRGAGDTRTPLYLMAVINSINILISWLLVNGQFGFPALGVNGSAIGTAVGRSLGGIILLFLFWRGNMRLTLEWDWRPDLDTIRKIYRVGLPAAGEMFIFQSAVLVMSFFITELGMVAYAAHTVTLTIESVSFLPGFGFAIAASAMVGQALGAEDPKLAERASWEALKQGGAMMTLLGIVMALWPGFLVSLVAPEAGVVALAEGPLRLAGLAQPFLAVVFIFMGALRGAGDTTWPLWMRMFTTWMVRVPLVLAFLFLTDWGLFGIWSAMTIDFVLQTFLVIWRFQEGRWKQIKL